jgi:hypothetical protein
MATLADELANDFLDDGSDVDNEENGVDLEPDTLAGPASKKARTDGGLPVLDGDEDVEDEDMGDDAQLGEAEEETEARLDAERKGQMPKDMRSVASFMKSLGPVLEVSEALLSNPFDQDLQSI